ncbi:MAG TPA: MFS transporter, partial [Alphaproteobacteria bacterium]
KRTKSIRLKLLRIWKDTRLLLKPVVILSGLGYLVDAFDIMTFSVVRTASLKSLGLEGDALTSAGMMIVNLQMGGMIIGGIVWGVLGDKLGRLKIMLASIMIYSVANIGNGFAVGVPDYAVWRFMAGFGLAGEIGAAVTIVSESLPRTKRGLGVMVIVSCAAMGGLLAGFIGQIVPWRVAYVIGGVAGLVLLALRISVKESKIFEHMVHDRKIERGNAWMILSRGHLLRAYIRCLLIGVPVWYIIGILVTLSPEFAKENGVSGVVTAGTAVSLSFGAALIGEYVCGILSQLWQSRRKALIVFMGVGTFVIGGFFTLPLTTSTQFYIYIAMLGFIFGYWVTFNTTIAEQFGTNLRATVATSIPNLVRGSVIPLNMMMAWLHQTMGYTYHQSGLYLGIGVMSVALIALWFTPETFHRDLEFVEK